MARLASLLALVLCLALALPSCRGRSLPASVDEPIRIGVVLPQSGGLAQDGQAWVRGVRLAAAEVNAAGGLLGGRRVELLVRDSGTDAQAGVESAREVLDMGAVAIIGDGGSAASLSVYQQVVQMAADPVVQISGSATSSSLTAANLALPATDRYFFRTAPPDGYQAQVVDRIATMVASPACTSLAILYQDDAYGMPLASGIRTLFMAHGTVGAFVPFMTAQPSYTTEVQRIADATPDCVALIAYPQDAGVILRDWAMLSSPPTVQWIGTDGLFSDDFIAEAGSDTLVAGFLGASPLTTPPTPEFNDFAARYDAAYGHAPENFVSSYYDATALVLLAIESAGNTEGADVRDALRIVGGRTGTRVAHAGDLRTALASLHTSPVRPLNYQGASGPIDFDESGDTVAPYEIWRITGSPADFAEVARVEAADLTPLP
ncbi:MAG: ABC transporter substrate-binding protein [Sandaracinus sp.]